MAFDDSLPVAFTVGTAQGLLALLDRMGGGPDPAPPRPSVGNRAGRENRQFVRVTSITVTSGTQPAKLQNLSSGVLSDGADVLVMSATAGEVLATGTYEGRMTHIDGGTGKPVFQVGKTGGGGWIRFRLANTLSATDAFQANCPVDYAWQGPSPGATVTVWNPPASVNYLFTGSTGKVGIATYDPAAGKWWIVQMEC